MCPRLNYWCFLCILFLVYSKKGSFLVLAMCKCNKITVTSPKALQPTKFLLLLSCFTLDDLFLFKGKKKKEQKKVFLQMKAEYNKYLKNINAWKLTTLQFKCGGKTTPFHNHEIITKEHKICPCIKNIPARSMILSNNSLMDSYLLVHCACNATDK